MNLTYERLIELFSYDKSSSTKSTKPKSHTLMQNAYSTKPAPSN